MLTYRNYTITYEPKPIPTRAHDFDYVHDEYDGGPEHSFGMPSDKRCGAEASVEACKEAIDELCLDETEEETTKMSNL